MITYKKLLQSIKESTSVIHKFNYLDESIIVRDNFDVYVENELIGSANSLEECKNIAKMYIDNKSQINLSEDVIVEKMSLFLDKKSINTKLVEFYKNTIENKEFYIDEVVTSLKIPNSFGKYEYRLNDGSIISIDEETQNLLHNVFEYKYDIVNHMCESIDTFKQVMRDIRSV